MNDKVVITAALTGALTRKHMNPGVPYRPEMASLNPGSINFNLVDWRNGKILADMTYKNPFNATLEFASIMKEKQIKPEMKCFSPSHIENVLWLREYYEFADQPLHFGFVFGVAGAMQFKVQNLANCVSLIPHDATWVGIGVGPNCMSVALASAAFGGHIRVGLEDNIWIDNTTKALSKGTYDQVERVVKIAHLVGRTPATVEETREIFRLRKA